MQTDIHRLDKLVKSFWNKDVYPELETVVIASHCTSPVAIIRL